MLHHLYLLPTTLTTVVPYTTLFRSKTNASGTVGTGTAYPFGPYLQADPTNPLNASSTVKVIAADVTGGADSTTTTAGILITPVCTKVTRTSAKFTKVYKEANPSNTT